MKGPSRYLAGFSDGGDYAIVDAQGFIIAETIWRVSDTEYRDAKSNVEFILKACSAHDDLVKALQELIAEGDFTAPEGMKRVARLVLEKHNLK